MISITQDLFLSLTRMKKRTGVTSLKKLMSFTKKRNEEFKGDYHQDCHEFFMWYVNEIDDALNGKLSKSD
jgi:ubiquitin carboxyl-terminal hydrolase 12/46